MHKQKRWQRLGSGCLLTLAACGTETIVHNIGEREANQMVELLSENDISANKGVADNGRTVTYSIMVPSGRRIEAIRLLNRYEMPRREDMGYLEIFKESGLIPTAGEEKAKQAAALEGEIEKQLKLVDGILDVQVQLVQPEENALRSAQELRVPTTASVTIKYMPAAGGAKPLSEPQVQAVVAAGVERLTADNVVVVMTPGGPMMRAERADADGQARGAGGRGVSDRKMQILGLTAGTALLLLCGLAVNLAARLSGSRRTLRRLQDEVARARRKPGATPPP